jgi:AGCS family alanine or glycine:cation symporter
MLSVITFSFIICSVQSNTIALSSEEAFGVPPLWTAIVIGALMSMTIFGGVGRVAKVTSMLVPLMAFAYILVVICIVLANINQIPSIFKLIIDSAFGVNQVVAGGVGAAIMMGVKRGLFSNEAGQGSAPNVAATADVSHPVKQGLIQVFGVFADTLIICSCTAFIILFSGVQFGADNSGIQLTQQALTSQIGSSGNYFIAAAIMFFAFSSIIGNYYYGEANVRYLTDKKWILVAFRLMTCGMVMFGAIASLNLAWSLADLCMGFMAVCNLVAIVLLSKYAVRLLNDYIAQKKDGKDPVFKKESMPDIQNDLECW